MGVAPSGSRFDFYVTDSSVLAVVVAEELVDGVDVKLARCIPQKKCGIFGCIPQKKCGKMEWQ